MLQCYNRGCGQHFDPEKNTDESCRHHPGAPYFHDAYKGWSCCNKKSVDFTEFLNIKGCTLSKHSNIKPPEPEKPAKDENEVDQGDIVVRAPIRESLPRPALETPMKQLQAVVAPALKETIDAFTKSAPIAAVPTAASANGVEIGTCCKNNGCNYSYKGDQNDLSNCIYHAGVPIFHEGMKYWSCCQKKTTDFTQFMAQKGCVYGEHKWFKENDNKKVVECRYDWHQTATNVIVSIYAKKYHYAQSHVEVNPIRLHALLVFPDEENAKFNLDLELRGLINVETATAHMYSTKVEITLPKLEPGSWQKLNFPRDTMPAVLQANSTKIESSENASDDEFYDLDDINTVRSYGVTVSELSSRNPNNLD